MSDNYLINKIRKRINEMSILGPIISGIPSKHVHVAPPPIVSTGIVALTPDTLYKLLIGEKLSSKEIEDIIKGRANRVWSDEQNAILKEIYPECFI